MENFVKDYPQFAKYLKKNSNFQPKDPMTTKWHWALLFVFGLLTVVSLQKYALLIALFIGLTALVKGPLMAFFGAAYVFLVGLFPPLAVVLSGIFFLLNISALTKSWRVSLITSYFYLYPLAMLAIRHFAHLTAWWQTVLCLLPGLLLLHFLLKWVYRYHPVSHQVFWTLFSTPFELFSLLLPKRFKDLRGKITKVPAAKTPPIKTPKFAKK